jgi:hypothetical protein
MSLRSVIFKNNESSGFVVEGDFDEIYQVVTKENAEFTVVEEKLTPGVKTDLSGFFNRPLLYVGKRKDDPNSMVFHVGTQRNLFGEKHYFEEVFWVSPTRIAVITGPWWGRDFNFVSGVWK